MSERGGRIVLVAATIGVAGAAQLVAYTTAIEGIRAMAKSAARQWADHGVGVNTVGVPLSLFAPELTDATAHLTAPAVADRDGLLGEVAGTVSFLLRRDIEHLIGQTIVVDGGSVMLP
jgi:3-oxoacyl-[acyl-carrier protein] reductase